MPTGRPTHSQEIPPSTQLALLRHLLRTAQQDAGNSHRAWAAVVEGDLLQDPLPAFTNVAVDIDLLHCGWPKTRI